MVLVNFDKTLIFERTLSRRVAQFSSKPYSLIFCLNKGIREIIRSVHFLLRLLFENKGYKDNIYTLLISRSLVDMTAGERAISRPFRA